MNKSVLGEIRAGFTTFVTMSYIIFVNPMILSEAGMPKDGVMFATCVASAIATFIMGIYAGYPFALAPGMGLNAYFTYGIVKGLGYTWQTALGAVFVEGIIFIILSASKVRSLLVDAIPSAIRSAVPVGIGLFIALIGMKQAGLIRASDATMVALGNVKSFEAILAFSGTLLAGVLMIRGFNGALITVIFILTITAVVAGKISLPHALVGFPDPHGTLLKMDLSHIKELTFWKAVLALLFVDMFDTIGTLSAVGSLGGFMENGRLPRSDRALMADAIGTTVGAILGTSTVTTYIESATGVAEGGRTGLTAVVVSFLFIASLFFYPLVQIVPSFATAPALILVGILMFSQALHIPWNRLDEAIPAFLTLFFMPATYSIANGLAAGFISYPIVKSLAGRAREVHPVVWVLCLLFLIKFVIL